MTGSKKPGVAILSCDLLHSINFEVHLQTECEYMSLASEPEPEQKQ